eukprot:symbB.v1.2.035625.t1/scaffold4844.1/size33976/5
MASILFRAVLLALLVGVEGLGQHRRQQDKQLKVAADDVEEDIANQLVKEAEATVERESDTPKESNGTKVKVETKKDSKEVKAKATKTPKVTPPSNTTVEESDDAFEKEVWVDVSSMLAVIFFWRMTLTDSGHGQQLHQPDGQGGAIRLPSSCRITLYASLCAFVVGCAWVPSLGRRALLSGAVAPLVQPLLPLPAAAGDGKRRNLAAAEMAQIVREDLVQRQFLATADFTPDIYDESCTFTDEIDTYQKDKFIKGTKALFVASESQVELLGDVDVLENGKKLQFRFQETLAFEAQLVK